MRTMSKKLVLVLIAVGCLPILVRSQFLECHDDVTLNPNDGPIDDIMFSWLAVMQYIHVKNGTPHYFRVPRVTLISRQFVLSTAVDAAEVPQGYALGNVIFGDYERDHSECQLTDEEIAAGADCPPAVMLMPIADVLLHPEYKHFGAKNSLAILKLLKPVKSEYVVPVCLPFKDLLIMRDRRQTYTKMVHVDYINDVPRDFIDENKEIQRLSLLPRELCFIYNDYSSPNTTRFVKNRMACSTGCGLHSGAPSVMQEHTGHWAIVSIALGGAVCPDLLRPRRPPPPPQHILIFPYVPWLTAAIAGKAVGGFAKDDPFGFAMARAAYNPHDLLWHGWVGHWYMGGPRCYDRAGAAEDMFLFYHEVFQVKPSDSTWMSYYIEIDAASGVNIICVKVGMPFRLGKPKVQDLNTPVVKVYVKAIHYQNLYRFTVEAFGYNSTSGLSDGESSSEEETCEDEYCEDFD